MKGSARAPVRVDPAGGGTDAPPFCIEHGGVVVNFAVGRHAFASAQRLEPGSGIILYAMDIQEGVTAASVLNSAQTTVSNLSRPLLLGWFPRAIRCY